MTRPQQPELARSGRTQVDPDHTATELQAERRSGSSGRTGPVPVDNLPGHHPAREQDKPDPAEFVAKAREAKRGPEEEQLDLRSAVVALAMLPAAISLWIASRVVKRLLRN